MPPRQPIVALQIDPQFRPACREDAAADRAALLFVQPVGHRLAHDPLFPSLAREPIPVSGAAQEARAGAQPPPQRRDRVANCGQEPRRIGRPMLAAGFVHAVTLAAIASSVWRPSISIM
jgi:hypothetical protein